MHASRTSFAASAAVIVSMVADVITWIVARRIDKAFCCGGC